MLNRLLPLHIIVILFLSSGLMAQLPLSSSAEYVAQTSYEYNGVTDSVFIFSENNPNKFIRVESPNDSLATFEWYAYNPGTNDFSLIETVSDVLLSFQTVTGNAGYRLVVTGNGNNITSEFWVIVNSFSVNIYNADEVSENGETYKTVPTAQKWCHLIRDINASIDSADLSYYNLNSGEALKFETQYEASWSSDPVPPEPNINRWFYNDDFKLRIDIEDPYWEDSWYYITIEDDFLFTSLDSVFYESIEPHADFSYEYIRLDNRMYYPDHNEAYYDDYYNSANYDHISAPARFMFNNLSINADTMIWSFGDEENAISGLDSLEHTYYLPGDYYPKLTVYNIVPHLYEVCTDTFPMADEEVIMEGDVSYPIQVENGTVGVDEERGINNVITIPPDGINDYFRLTGDVSITDFEIKIYNRYGGRVYKFEGNIRDWEGWNGTDDGTENYVNSGVYFYVVKKIFVLPMDYHGRKPKLFTDNPNAENHVNDVYRGFIHVFNTE